MKKILRVFIFCFVYSCLAAANTDEQKLIPETAAAHSVFVENKGQLLDMNNNPRPDLLYKADVQGGHVYLGKSGMNHVLVKYEGFSEESIDKLKSLGLDTTPIIYAHRVDMQFLGANKNPVVEKFVPLTDYKNYYYAHCPDGILNVHSYQKLIYKDVYPNIDIMYYGEFAKGLKYDFILHPGANPGDIRIKIEGADRVYIGTDNTLNITTSLGNITENMPRVYIKNDERIEEVRCHYRLSEDKTITYDVENYDHSKTLVIDPALWVTYFGGTDDDISQEIIADANGNVITCGVSASVNFPVSAGAFQLSLNNAVNISDGVIVKFDKDGNLLWSTYYGSTGGDVFISAATDPVTNDIAIIGHTGTNTFPISTATMPYQSSIAGGNDVCVIKLDASGVRKWATFYGGSGRDFAQDISVASNGDVIIAGETRSNNLPIANSFQNTYGGLGTSMTPMGDGFVAKLNNAGTALLFGSYLGANACDDAAHGVIVDKLDNIIVVGSTQSTSIAPLNMGIQPTNAGMRDGFIVKLNSSGTPLWATYFGGNNLDVFRDVKTNSVNDIIVGISTRVGGNNALRVLKFLSSTGAVIWDYFPTPRLAVNPSSIHCAIDKYDNTYIYCESEGVGVAINPGACSYQTTSKPNNDDIHYIVKLNNNGNLICTSFWNMQGHDEIGSNFNPDNSFDFGGGGIACYEGYIYCSSAMWGTSNVTSNAYQTINKGERDFVIGKFCGLACSGIPDFNTSLSASATNICTGSAVSYTSNFNFCDTTDTKYAWSFPGAVTTTSTNKNPGNIVYSASGKYDVQLIVETPCGNDTAKYINYINVDGPLVTIGSVNHLSCFGNNTGSISVVVSGGSGNINYSWTPASIGTNSISNLAAGAYSLTVSDASGCTSALTVTLTEPVALQAIVPVQSNILCNGDATGSASGTAIGGTIPYSYSWSNGQSTQITTGLYAGTFQLVVTDANNCTSTSMITITQPLKLDLGVLSINNKCYNNSTAQIHTTASGGVSPYFYSWNTGSTTSALTQINAGVYSVTVTDNHNCSIDTTITITEPTQLITSIANKQDESCSGKNDGWINASATGGNLPYTYQWNNSSNNNSVSNLSAGVYTLTVTDANGCTDVFSGSIFSAIALNHSVITSSLLCYGDANGTANVIITGGSPDYTYNWSNGTTNNTINNLAAGVYTLTVTDVNGCNIIVPVSISQPQPLMITISPSQSICLGDAISLSASASGGAQAYTYSWSTTQNTSSINVQPSANTAYALFVIDANNCTSSDSVFITVNALPVISFTSDKQAACSPACFNLTNTTPNTNTVQWNFSDGTLATPSLYEKCFYADGIYSFTLTVIDNNGCSNSSINTNYFTAYPVPVAAFASNPSTATILEPVIKFTNQSGNYTHSFWNFGDDKTSAEQSPVHSYSDTGSYYVLLVVKNDYGCVDSASQFVQILPDFSIYVPNTFTPNGDGKNEFFIPVGAGIAEDQYEFLIFDRWGNQIFYTNDSHKGWDGRIGSELVQQDTYVWKLTCKGIEGTKTKRVGHVNVVR